MTTAPPTQSHLERLVGFASVSEASNLDLIAYVEETLSGSGIAATRVASADGRKASLFATIGPKVPGGVVLSGHTDVVPAAGQSWTYDPFCLTHRGERLYGRGTTDMKSFLAIALGLVPDMLAADLKRPIHLALSYDEEIGCLGAPALIAAMGEAIPEPSAVIVGEPTKMAVCNAHKGVLALTTRVTGLPVHSSVVHKGVSATAYAARLAVWLDERMATLAAGQGASDPRFDPPYTTLHSGILKGGTALNITAGEAMLRSDIRALPGDDPRTHLAAFRAEAERLSQLMRAVDPTCGIEITVDADVPPCRGEENGAAEALAHRLTEATDTETAEVVAFGTEAGQFQAAGLSTIVCGPGDMAQGHTPDEFIEISQLRAGEAFQRRLIAELSR
ncbi:acetylornithine deacetylase [Jiella mangrovi]|uniref:Acetylornithine deacetylase n=1 Tax=Jiella mangrovi TaxID=2821407 RepID=A0ABS4BNE6_9HYPH|nr:acetylornithine deacetylase [Jiella mangrovi]MBP0617721.1 acetylornithine deacetylase [Jiella mangrovi]